MAVVTGLDRPDRVRAAMPRCGCSNVDFDKCHLDIGLPHESRIGTTTPQLRPAPGEATAA